MVRLPAALRFLVYPGLVVAAAILLLTHHVHGAPDSGYGELPSEQEMQAFDHELSERYSVIAARLACKDSLVQDLVDGRADLAQVTEAFLRLNRAQDSCMDIVRTHYAGRTDEEKTARNVFDFVKAREMPRAQKAAVLKRLDAEFARRFPA